MEFAPQLIVRLRAAQRVAALTGAGVSAESGVPTFRDAQAGLWARYDPTELATPEAFRHNPRLVWEWYAFRRGLVSNAQPNPAHLALVEMERHYVDFTLITQNVDGLHRRAGSQKLLELHGNIARTRCFACGVYTETWDEGGALPPRCAACGNLLRPDVVWFGESLPEQALAAAFSAAGQAQIFFSIGTSALVQPAASLPLAARRAGAYVVEINPEDTPLSPYADACLRGAAGQILPALIAQVFGGAADHEEGS